MVGWLWFARFAGTILSDYLVGLFMAKSHSIAIDVGDSHAHIPDIDPGWTISRQKRYGWLGGVRTMERDQKFGRGNQPEFVYLIQGFVLEIGLRFRLRAPTITTSSQKKGESGLLFIERRFQVALVLFFNGERECSSVSIFCSRFELWIQWWFSSLLRIGDGQTSEKCTWIVSSTTTEHNQSRGNNSSCGGRESYFAVWNPESW